LFDNITMSVPLLSPADLALQLSQHLPNWHISQEPTITISETGESIAGDICIKLRRVYKCKNFMSAMEFANKIAICAASAQLYPDLRLYNEKYFDVSVYSPAAHGQGITADDIELALSIDDLPIQLAPSDRLVQQHQQHQQPASVAQPLVAQTAAVAAPAAQPVSSNLARRMSIAQANRRASIAALQHANLLNKPANVFQQQQQQQQPQQVQSNQQQQQPQQTSSNPVSAIANKFGPPVANRFQAPQQQQPQQQPIPQVQQMQNKPQQQQQISTSPVGASSRFNPPQQTISQQRQQVQSSSATPHQSPQQQAIDGNQLPNMSALTNQSASQSVNQSTNNNIYNNSGTQTPTNADGSNTPSMLQKLQNIGGAQLVTGNVIAGSRMFKRRSIFHGDAQTTQDIMAATQHDLQMQQQQQHHDDHQGQNQGYDQELDENQNQFGTGGSMNSQSSMTGQSAVSRFGAAAGGPVQQNSFNQGGSGNQPSVVSRFGGAAAGGSSSTNSTPNTSPYAKPAMPTQAPQSNNLQGASGGIAQRWQQQAAASGNSSLQNSSNFAQPQQQSQQSAPINNRFGAAANQQQTQSNTQSKYAPQQQQPFNQQQQSQPQSKYQPQQSMQQQQQQPGQFSSQQQPASQNGIASKFGSNSNLMQQSPIGGATNAFANKGRFGAAATATNQTSQQSHQEFPPQQQQHHQQSPMGLAGRAQPPPRQFRQSNSDNR
jgi:pterin-4a-carbinolamine dehydratase